jgi:NAD(P)-dependent dehydrogenase (short-subunit alcohol dehydrogenase family)
MSTSEALQDARVVVVGGTSGMGRGVVDAALAAGAEVVVAGRRPIAERGAAQPRVIHEVVDVASEVSVRDLFARIGALDHLVVTAAPPPGAWRNFLDDDVAGAEAYLRGKFWGSWAAARYAAPRMRAATAMAPRGSIAFVTGGIVARPRAGASIVAAAFAALENLSRALAIELGPLRVNTIRPGYTDSEMWSFLDPAAREALRARVSAAMPVRRMGTVGDIGHAAVFLMTNPQVTGSILEITGGETLVDGL